jgi:diaminohydroxyphosphoribosylaminopyrimidine deaminase/5-amino-6-(5-phosphoribosylamino)uracil reductase
MDEALDLARRGVGCTSPNPAVGAVLVKSGEVVGRGFHTYAQRKHAEILALDQAGERARDATLYITLEPCSHHGRTPPCADALVKAGVTRVVAAMEDPNPLVAGKDFASWSMPGSPLNWLQTMPSKPVN